MALRPMALTLFRLSVPELPADGQGNREDDWSVCEQILLPDNKIIVELEFYYL
jgi:hypothetical protein